MKSVMDKKELHHIVLKEQCNICQIVALKKGVMVYSDTWHDITKENAFHIASATKSIMSLLIGIAIDKGFIAFTTTNQKNRYIRLTNVKGTNNLRDFYYRDIVLGEQSEQVYNPTNNFEIALAFREAGEIEI